MAENHSDWVGSSASYISARAPGQPDAWSEELAITGRTGTQRLLEVIEVLPPSEVARALRLAADDRTVVRRRVMLVDDRPIELTDSYYPLLVAGGTALAEARKIPGGAPTLLAELGQVSDEVIEDLTVRPASPHEAQALKMSEESLVITLLRVVFNTDGMPFEASVMTMIPEGRHFRYRLKMGEKR